MRENDVPKLFSYPLPLKLKIDILGNKQASFNCVQLDGYKGNAFFTLFSMEMLTYFTLSFIAWYNKTKYIEHDLLPSFVEKIEIIAPGYSSRKYGAFVVE